MADKTQILVLAPSAEGEGCEPQPNPWKLKKKEPLAIVNASGYDQVLTNITADVLKNADGEYVTEIEISEDGFWLGEADDKGGLYVFDDGTDRADPRVGTIDPS